MTTLNNNLRKQTVSSNTALDENAYRKTITLRCHLRNVLTLAAQESVTIATVLQMGLLPVLDKLASRGHELNDSELEKVLYLLDL